MKRHFSTLLAFGLCLSALAIDIPGKQIYIPEELRQNNFESDTARWSYSRMALTPNFAIFWERGFGADLSNPPQLEGRPMRIDLENLKQKLERFYTFYRDTLHFIGAGSNAEKYRMMVMLNYSLEGTAYGGDYDEFIGAFWVAPNRLQDRSLNCVAHELGHSFQMQVHCDKKAQSEQRRASSATDQFIDTQDSDKPETNRWFGGGFFEMTSQWMLWHVNPYWVRDELYHWQAYQRTPHKAFLHWENIYHSPYVLEWWSQNHGLDIIGDIYKTAHNPEDPADAYMRLTRMNTSQFNDDLFEANRHTIFLDFKHARLQTRPFAGVEKQPKAGSFQTDLIEEQSGYHRISPAVDGNWVKPTIEQLPEAGGFNAIPLHRPSRGESVSVDFEGLTSLLATDTTYHVTRPEIAGWRYGFAALMADGSCAYSPIYNKVRGRATFTAPTSVDVHQLYLVVMAAPTSRHPEADRPRNGQRRHRRQQQAAPQWPYRIRLL